MKHYAKFAGAICACCLAACCLTGCEEDDKQVAADTIDAIGNAANHLAGKAPSGEEIVNGVEGIIDSIDNMTRGNSNGSTSNSDN